MPFSPSLSIANSPGAGVIAEGSWDELSAALLRRAGFVPVTTPRSAWWRVPYDLEPAEENAIATRAYEMLTAARYKVSIGPELRHRPSAAAREISALATEIRRATSAATVTELLAGVSDPDHGVLRALSHLLADAATCIGRQPTEEARSAAGALLRTADVIDSVQDHVVQVQHTLSVPAPPRGDEITDPPSAHARVTAARARSTTPADATATTAPEPPPAAPEPEASALPRRL